MPFRHIVSIKRRVPGIVDLLIDDQPQNASFTLQWQTLYNGVFATPVVIPQSIGARYGSVAQHPLHYEGYDLKNVTRFLFNPVDVGGGMPDDGVFWIEVEVMAGPNAGVQDPYPIVPYSPTGRVPFVVSGTAPNAVAISGSDRIIFPYRSEGVSVKNNGASALMIAFEPNGNEIKIVPEGTSEPPFIPVRGVSELYIRGVGGTSDFTLMADLNIGG